MESRLPLAADDEHSATELPLQAAFHRFRASATQRHSEQLALCCRAPANETRFGAGSSAVTPEYYEDNERAVRPANP